MQKLWVEIVQCGNFSLIDQQRVYSYITDMDNEQRLEAIEAQLVEANKTLKAIRWTMAGGFLYIIMVMSGIIKLGIFS